MVTVGPEVESIGTVRRVLAIGLLGALAMLAQTGVWPVPLATFTGTVRGADKKSLLLELPDSNTLQFFCSGKTRYYDGSKRIRADAIKAGARVSVDASRGLDGKLDAVTVRLLRPENTRKSR
jgi:hypothetical protein